MYFKVEIVTQSGKEITIEESSRLPQVLVLRLGLALRPYNKKGAKIVTFTSDYYRLIDEIKREHPHIRTYYCLDADDEDLNPIEL